MNSRRNFLKHFGIGGAVVAVAAAAHQYSYEQSKPELTDEDIKHLAPNSNTLLTLHADNRTPEEKAKQHKIEYGDYSKFVFTSSVTTHQVHMSVGKDNRLWLKVGDKWKRVALDTEV